MNIAYTMAPGRGDTNLLLDGLARRLTSRGLRAAGTVQIDSTRPDDGPCDMGVRVLPDGPVIRISQSLGAGSTGCRLDPNALETAVGLVTTRLEDGADCLLVNKFGKHEAEGRGFRPVIAEALARDIPVLVGVNALNLGAFETFCGGLAIPLPPDIDHLQAWVEDHAALCA
jgi:hypothetical protein